jgi:subtilisin family serine protease
MAMKKKTATSSTALLLPPTGGNPAFAMALKRQLLGQRRIVEGGRVLVKFDPASLQPAAPATAARGARVASVRLAESVAAPLRWLQDNAGLRSVEPLFAAAPLAARVAAKAAAPGLSRAARGAATAAALSASRAVPQDYLAGYNCLELDAKHVDEKLLRKLRQAPGVQAADRPPLRWMSATAAGETVADPRQNSQWALRAIGWYDQPLPDASDIRVGVLDSGIDATHPDLAAHLASYDQSRFARIDHVGHGTHVAGIIAAVANNSVGIAGVANCKLRVWKVFGDRPDVDGQLYVNDTAYVRALGNAAASDVRIVNLSLGGVEANQIESELVALLQKQGKVVVAAMGNEFTVGNPTEWPAACPGVVAVGAVTINLRRAAFSNTGRHIAIAAPGKSILSTLPMKRSRFREEDEVEYASWDGTSMATPCVVGCLALALARRPTLTARDLTSALPRATRRPASMRSRFSTQFGHGVINLPRLFAAI